MAKPRVAIGALRLVDPKTKQVISRQRWLYARELSRLLLEMGFAVLWYQIGSGWHSQVLPGVPLIGCLPDESQLNTWPKASHDFWEQSGTAELAIYFDGILAYPQVHENAIAIAHGIEWNHPLMEAHLPGEREREEWKRRLWMALCAPTRVVAVDSGVIQWATATWPGLYNQFVHIPNFVVPSLDLLHANDHDHPGDAKGKRLRVVYRDALGPQGGIAETLDVMDALFKNDAPVELVIAGHGTPEVEQYISDWVKEREGAAFISGEMDSHMLQNAALLMPAKWGVGSSFYCLQAMAAGAAPVVGQMSGLTDLIIHDHNGWIIQSSTDGIRQALHTLIEHPGECDRLGANARKTAEAFSLDVWRTRWRHLIETGGRERRISGWNSW